MMTYTASLHFPGALTDCAASVLRTISSAGVWMPDPRAVNSQQLRALLQLRNSGYIEMAAYVGYRVRANQFTVASQKAATEPPAAAIAAILRDAGIEPVGKILPCKTAWAWNANCWAFVLPRGVVLGAAREAFKKVVCNDRLVVVELKG